MYDKFNVLLHQKPFKPTEANRSIKPPRRWWRLLWIIPIIIVGLAIWYGSTIYTAISKVTTNHVGVSSSWFRSSKSDAAASTLQTEGGGRINILLAGIGGAGHDGPYLADSIEVMSINPTDYSVVLISIPRDLYVTVPGYGLNKINAADSLGEASSKTPGGGAVLLKETVSKVLGLPIQYYIRLDFNGFTQMVDSVGGVDVNVATALYDPLYPCPDPSTAYCPLSVSTGQHHFTGDQALKYARSRETTSDFSRSARQQQIIEAFKTKVLSLGVLTNPQKVTSLISTAGNHMLTDLSIGDAQQLATLLYQNSSKIKLSSKVIDNGPGGVLKSETASNGAYILVPIAGQDNYSGIQAMVHQYLTDPLLSAENAKIEIRNASGTPGLGTKAEKVLTDKGYVVGSVISAPTTTEPSLIYDQTNGKKPNTTKLVSQDLGIAVTTKALPGTASTADLVIVLGKDYNGN